MGGGAARRETFRLIKEGTATSSFVRELLENP